MRKTDILRIAFSTFRNNKMRTILTIFGVSIGIGAIVFLFSLGYGIQKITIGEITSIKALTTYNISSGNSSIIKLNNESLDKISKIKNVESVDPAISSSGQAIMPKTQTDIIVNLASSRFVDLESPKLSSGEYYTNDAAKEALLTEATIKAFDLSSQQILGKEVSIKFQLPDGQNSIEFTQNYNVKGVIKEGAAAYVYIPIDSVAFPKNTSFSIVKAKVSDSREMEAVKQSITDLGFQSTSVGEKIDQLNKIFNIAKFVLIGLGAIALIVAAIGMFNTLTISLLERTKDIGVMKALGATDKEIYLIFLTESGIISLAGGICGVVLSFAVGTALNVVVMILAKNAGGEPARIVQAPIYFVIFILTFSMLAGIFTGLYPARRAAKLNPLDALRYE